MSDYKYKGQLSTLADMYLNTGDHEPLLEIERVYTQAAKADEHEGKAKNWDVLKMKLKGMNKGILRKKDPSEEELIFVDACTSLLWEMGDLESSEQSERD